MKGTNNLFILAINEYLRDYGKYANVPSALADIKDNLSKINISDINVSEYFDHTEYFNICCDTSISALGGLRDVSERFWQGGAMDRDGRDFTRQQIDRFYLSSMLVKNGLTGELGHEDLTSFLDVIFDYGAKRQCMGADGYFATQLSGGEFTNTVVDRLIRLSSDYLWLAGYAPSYSFKTASLSA